MACRVEGIQNHAVCRGVWMEEDGLGRTVKLHDIGVDTVDQKALVQVGPSAAIGSRENGVDVLQIVIERAQVTRDVSTIARKVIQIEAIAACGGQRNPPGVLRVGLGHVTKGNAFHFHS